MMKIWESSKSTTQLWWDWRSIKIGIDIGPAALEVYVPFVTLRWWHSW